MRRYRYNAVSSSGDALSGEITAASWEDAVVKIGALGHVPISAELADGSATSPQTAPRRASAIANGSIRTADLAHWTDQLATMLEASLPLDEALGVVNRARRRLSVGEEIYEDVRKGRLLSEALARRNGAFPSFYVGLVRAGEAGGALAETLRQLAEFLGRSAEARARLRGALAYPVFLLLMATASVVLVLTVVVPSLLPLFADAGDTLPSSTRILIAASQFLREHGWLLLACAAATPWLVMAAFRLPSLRRPIDRLALRLPLIGPVIRKSEAARILRTLGMLLKNGVPTIAALDTVKGAARNLILSEEVGRLTEAIRAGRSFALELERGGQFPDAAVQLALVGERSGQLDAMLVKSGDLMEAEAEKDAERALAMLSPALTIIMGAAIGGVALSLVTAILSVNNVVY